MNESGWAQSLLGAPAADGIAVARLRAGGPVDTRLALAPDALSGRVVSVSGPDGAGGWWEFAHPSFEAAQEDPSVGHVPPLGSVKDASCWVTVGTRGWGRYLPEALLWGDGNRDAPSFAERLLLLVEEAWSPLDDVHSRAVDAFDPRRASERFLRWMASWFGADPDLDAETLRRLLPRIAGLEARRGTPAAITERVSLETGITVTLRDGGPQAVVVGSPDRAGSPLAEGAHVAWLGGVRGNQLAGWTTAHLHPGARERTARWGRAEGEARRSRAVAVLRREIPAWQELYVVDEPNGLGPGKEDST